MELYPSMMLKSRWLNKLVRVLHGTYPSRWFRKFGVKDGPCLVRLGSDYGGWFAPTSIQQNWIIYSLGIGQDTTFDWALIEQYGVTIHAFDPTPAAIEHVSDRRAKSPLIAAHFLFSPVGVWDSDCSIRFFEPKTRGWVGSYSALNLQGTSRHIDAPCKTLSTLMRERNHDHVDLLKMDIEGAEYRVLGDLLTKRIPVHWLCVEFDQPVPTGTTRTMIKRLIDNGFALCHVDRWNFTFENRRYAS